MPKNQTIKKVLVIGSGPIVIGQAAEFDYAGTQACRSLKEEGVEVVLVNSNPATIMTDKEIADEVYIEPLTVSTLEEIIKKEKPDGVLPTLGGQAGLNLGMELAESGFLEKHGVKLIGTTAETIFKAEDRQAFKDTMEKIGEPCAASKVVHNVEDGIRFTNTILLYTQSPLCDKIFFFGVFSLLELYFFGFCYIIEKNKRSFYHGKKESGCQYPGMCCLRMLHKSLSGKCDHRSPRHPCGH